MSVIKCVNKLNKREKKAIKIKALSDALSAFL